MKSTSVNVRLVLCLRELRLRGDVGELGEGLGGEGTDCRGGGGKAEWSLATRKRGEGGEGRAAATGTPEEGLVQVREGEGGERGLIGEGRGAGGEGTE